MSPTELYIIGNGFDRAHGMESAYFHFKTWLITNHRQDVIIELEKVFSEFEEDDYLLWSDFEKALGQYDANSAANWDFNDILIVEDVSPGKDAICSVDVLQTRLCDIVQDVFPLWIKDIKPAKEKILSLPYEAAYLSFNYTNTLESLYGIHSRRICHIHGCIDSGNALIVGHRCLAEPLDYVLDGSDFRTNNKRIQNICDLNELYKPIETIIEAHSDFFSSLSSVVRIKILGHSCSDIDSPYYQIVKESVSPKATWCFSWHDKKNDLLNIEIMRERLSLSKDKFFIEYF